MTDAPVNGKNRNSWARSARLALYAVALLAVLLWMRHEEAEHDAIQTAAAESNARLQPGIDVANQRVEAAFALVNTAVSTKDLAEKIRIYDEIIDTYQDDEKMPLMRCVSWALCRKAESAEEVSEKSRLFEMVIDKYCDVTNEDISKYVMEALRGMLQLAGNGAEKIAFCDSILEKYGNRLYDSSAALILSKKAESIRNKDEKIVLYDTIFSRFLSSSSDSAFDQAIIAAMDKVELIGDKDEQLRLCDIAIDAFLKTPQRTRYYLFERAVRGKARLVGDPSLSLLLCNQVIANNVTEESVVQARSMRMLLLKDDNERLAACDETITIHQNSKKDFVQLMVVRAMMQKVRFLSDPEKKAALLRSVVEKSKTIKDSRTQYEVDRALAMLVTLSGDTDSAIQYYDEAVAKATTRMDAIRSLRSKIRLLDDPAEKIRLLDEIIAMVGDSRDASESREAINAIIQKVALIDNKDEKIKLYDSIIAMGVNSGDSHQRTVVGEAMIGKAQLIDDREEKIRLYDSALFDIIDGDRRYFLFDAFKERIALATGVDEKLRLYDRYIDIGEDDGVMHLQIPFLLEKAEITPNLADRLHLYDKIIGYCERRLNADRNVGKPTKIREFEKELLMNYFGKAILARADLSEDSGEKMKLYDKYLALPQFGISSRRNKDLEKILAIKAELSGNPSLMDDYFDDKIRTAATDRECVEWYNRKAKRFGMFGKEAIKREMIEEEMIAKFFDSTDKDVEKIIADAFYEKIRRTHDPDKKNELSDRLIARYRNSVDDRVQSIVIQAMIAKAETIKNENKRIELYSDIIERHKDAKGIWIKGVVDKAIVAKFRLESEGKK